MAGGGPRAGVPGRTVAGRPLPVFLIAIEKGVSALAALAGAVLALLLHIHGSTDPLRFLFPGEVSEVPRDITVRWIYSHLPHIGPGLIVLAAIGLTFWGALLGAEAVGVWMGWSVGEFLLIVETASFLPFELYDIARHPQPAGVITLMLNLLILWYVSSRYRRRSRERFSRPASAGTEGQAQPGEFEVAAAGERRNGRGGGRNGDWRVRGR